MILKIAILLLFFAVMIGVGIYCRKSATDVKGFVLGGRNVGLDIEATWSGQLIKF